MTPKESFSYLENGKYPLRRKKISKQRQYWLLENHPCFTGLCNQCGYQYPRFTKNWDCPECGYKWNEES